MSLGSRSDETTLLGRILFRQSKISIQSQLQVVLQSEQVPDWVQTAADNWTFNKQLREYVAAAKRLELDAVVASEDIPATVEVSTTRSRNNGSSDYRNC